MCTAARLRTTDLPLMSELCLQDSWSGTVSIAADQEMYYWYFPTTQPEGTDDLVVWLNGGPGCSSLFGFFIENGPIRYAPYEPFHPYTNPNSWTNIADVVYVDQPVSTGYSRGTVKAENEDDVAEEFFQFLIRFFQVYPELKKRNLFITGESYAAYYITYIARRILKASKHELSQIAPLKTIMIGDGSWAAYPTTEELPMYRFVEKHQDGYGFTDDFVARVKTRSVECGFEKIMDEWLVYPARSGLIPYPSEAFSDYCDIWTLVFNEAKRINPNFWDYRVGPEQANQTDELTPYLNRADVQEVLNVRGFGPYNLQVPGFWGVFKNNYDNSRPPCDLLPELLSRIEVTIWQGLNDSLLLAEGTRLVIQNTTWLGSQATCGFHNPPEKPLLLNGEKKGTWNKERGLTYIEVDNAGHLIPFDAPEVALKVLGYLLGKETLT
ncbi:alpha/beta-hydrolase [Atractiella rhizophila]|nr:alpha/beta-hydrolase [Atractiella rhizophila]